jgi:putative flavoprotein involved in K+ transport
MTDTLERSADATAAADRADTWLSAFSDALTARDVDRAAGMFATESYWRDLIAFSWNITTVEHPDGVRDLLTETLERTDPGSFAREDDAEEADGVITAWFRFETAVGRGRGLVRLVSEDGPDRAWTFLTTVYELKGHEEPAGDRRPMGAEHGANKGRLTWAERRAHEAEALGVSEQPYVLVIGGGQGGIALGARLRQLGVPALVVDKHARPGDQWRKRYKSLCLHDPVWYDHLPYLKFPDNWPVFAPKDKIGDWLESYVDMMEVPYWSSTTATSGVLVGRGGGVDRRGRA